MLLLLCLMEERMPSSNAFSPEMLFPPDMFSPGEGMLNCQKSFHQRKVDDAIWAAENATLKAEMSGKKLMHSWNNLSSTLSFRRFKRGFGILQLYLMVLELPVYKGLLWQRDHVALGSSFDGRCCWSYIKKKYLKRAGTQSKLGG
ncbi:uncharacterized protein LOC125478243 [Pyrus x bretschneideri]|uniref:uncharacterized protein LOC125478243 n=1 Tax=Pyrus x bretschneideri TaxID=225117 RepID=UPI00202DC33D|nr:uncharacterized protein LOC125478243 [Pyrus x bretschneideri]